MRISDWSSDVCSSDLDGGHGHAQPPFRSSRLIGAERQPTSDCRQSLQQSHSVNDEMKIQEDEGRFIVNLGFRFGFYIGGSNDWTKLVDALDEIFAERGQKIVERLQARTGREWSIAQGQIGRAHV